jgi:hypothetical protein
MQPHEKMLLKFISDSTQDSAVSKAKEASNLFIASGDALQQACCALEEQLARSERLDGSAIPEDKTALRDEKWAAHVKAANNLLAACSEHVLTHMERLQTDLSVSELSRLKDAIGMVVHGASETGDQGTVFCHDIINAC